VIALRDEARVLRDLAHERLPAPVAPARAGRGVALGLPLTIGALALVSLGVSAAIEALPRPVRWFAPTESLGVTRMLVDLVFAIRENFAAWFDFAFALAALAAVAGVAYLASDLLLRRTRTGARAAALVARHHEVAGAMPLRDSALDDCGGPFDLVINSTSSSMQGIQTPVPAALLRHGALAIDLMYGPAAEPFLDWARSRGAQARDGLGMLVEQAAEAFYVWRGVRPHTPPVLRALREHLAQPGA